MFTWFKSLFKKKETPIQRARRLGYKYIKLVQVGTNKPRIQNGRIFVVDVVSDKMTWVEIDEYERANKEMIRGSKIDSLLN